MKINIDRYRGPVGGWGSARSLIEIMLREHIPLKGPRALLRQNKPDGFECVSCSYAKPEDPKTFEFCENGAKATAWEITDRRCPPEFFDRHTVSSLESWSDYKLEELGRLTEPLKWDANSDKYVPVSWNDAFTDIGRRLNGFNPQSVIFYTSGRASLEASYMYQLFARMYGTNNLPDSSNMCHESTSVALPQTIGVPVGTVKLEDFDRTDCIMFFGQNVGVNSPRMLHQLQRARQQRNVPIITFNPLYERGLERFTNPQSIKQMLTLSETRISTQYHQVNPGGDLAAMVGIAKVLIEDEERTGKQILDREFIAQQTSGFEDFAKSIRGFEWKRIERCSGLTREAIKSAAETYANAKAVIACYGMGLTQHRSGVLAIQMLSNLLLLRGNIGKPGAGIFPVRGHSNVQGQRTVGITEKPELVPLDQLARQFHFEPPREKGRDTVGTCEGVLKGNVKAFIALGGNFIRAVPETVRMERAWRELDLTVQIVTKLNRGVIVHGRSAYILPCLGRIERDRQATGLQFVTVEDTTGRFHASHGQVEPASPDLLSEPKIVAGIAAATLDSSAHVDWDGWTDDYSRIREAIATTYPNIFADFNQRIMDPAGFDRPIAARERKWMTKTGKANFIAPPCLFEDPDLPRCREGILTLITVRSNDQFNTTVYGYNDRLRGIKGTRSVVLMNEKDMEELGIHDGDDVDLHGDAGDQATRIVTGMRATTYDVPRGSCAGYFPECNPLLPLWHHASGSHVPAAKSIPIRIVRQPIGHH
ncbi:MAG TPA: FdhF/YdeP family oxidoreductase [Hyphomicrobium sp.]|nr:FdhF/YdeP family oxidoreductase [Hyphomicrobium sp.]